MIDILLRFLYGLGYKQILPDQLVHNLLYPEVFALADKYDVKKLNRLAAILFIDLAKVHEAALWQDSEFPSIIRTLYTDILENQDALRQFIVEIVAPHLEELLVKSKFKQSLTELGESSKDLIEYGLKAKSSIAATTKARDLVRILCTACSIDWTIDVSEFCARNKFTCPSCQKHVAAHSARRYRPPTYEGGQYSYSSCALSMFGKKTTFAAVAFLTDIPRPIQWPLCDTLTLQQV